MAKKRKISVRRILQVFLTLVVTTACIIAMAGAAKIDDNTTLKNIEIHIRNDKKYHFIEEKEIMDLAINNRNVDIVRTPLSKLDIHSMEKVIKSDPWVADAQVFVDNGRVLHMYVTQRIPVARLFQKNSVSYYMDTTMSIMPLSNKNIYYTTVVTNMPELKNDSSSWVLRQQVISLVRTIEADSFWNSQISQVIVDSSGMFELLPVLGNQTILFGDASRMRDKFNNLFSFYKNVLNRIGWDKYETLDVRFNGQVIASPSLPYKGPVDKAVVNMNWINSIVESEAKKDEIDSMHGTGSKDIHAEQKITQAKAAPVTLKQNKEIKANSVQKKGANTAAVIPAKPTTVPGKQKDEAKTKPAQKQVVNTAAKKDTKKADKKKQADKLKKKKTEPNKKDKAKSTGKEKNNKQVSPKYVYPEKKDR